MGVFPPYPYLPEVVRAFEGLEASGGAKVYVGGQDLHPAAKGAFTSQVSGPMLKDVGATHTLIGHSERRDLFGDTDMLCREKMVAALEYGIKPVLCVGEHLEDREAGRTAEVVLGQVEQGLQGFSEGDLADLIIAYEPVWAIGTGKTATPEQAGEAHKIIPRLDEGSFLARFRRCLTHPLRRVRLAGQRGHPHGGSRSGRHPWWAALRSRPRSSPGSCGFRRADFTGG